MTADETIEYINLINDARQGRTDEQALFWLAEMVMTLRRATSAGMIRARQGPTPVLKLDDKDPVG
jgi:hypothetical protein